MRTTCIHILGWMILVLFPISGQTLFPWPVTPFNQSHEITGNFSEYRDTSTNGHFHDGTDIPKTDGSPVYPVKDGIVTSLSRVGSNAFVRINELAYVHILPTVSLSIGDSVFAQQTILGTILSGLGHVHFTNGFNGVEINSLRIGSGLDPVNDPWAPIIRFTNFYGNNSDLLLDRNTLSGKVDIMVKVDEQNGPPSSSISRRNNGTYEIGYKILNEAGDSIVYEPSANGVRYRFDNKLSDSYVNRVYYRPLSTTSSHVYQVTNNIISDNFWDTALLPFGNYQVMTFTRDTSDNTDTMYTAVTTIAPDLTPPQQPVLRSVTETANGMLITWRPNTDTDLLGYRLYFTFDNIDWTLFRTETQLTSAVTELAINQIIDRDVYYRLTAVDNAPGIRNESVESDVYGMSNGVFNAKVLIVDGFDRTDGKWTAGQHEFGVRLGQALIANAYSFDTVPNESVIDSSVLLEDYAAVFWMLGDESVVDETFSDQEQEIASNYLKQGGNLFVSGVNVAWDLDGSGSASISDREFLNDNLQCEFVSKVSALSASGSTGSFLENIDINFGQMAYSPDSLDAITPLGDAIAALTYSTGEVAGIAYNGIVAGGTSEAKLIYLSLPIETLNSDSVYNLLINRSLAHYFGPTAIDDRSSDAIAAEFTLSANYPNPFNPETTMKYLLPKAADISLVVYNLLGQPVRILASGIRQSGEYQASWDGTDHAGSAVASGIYLIRFYARVPGQEAREQVRKMTLLR